MSNKVNISEVDYEGHRESFIEVLKKDPTFADYDYEGTALAGIVRLLSMHESDLASSANLTFFERYIRTAQLRGNLAAAAVDQSYIPHGKVSAKVKATITVSGIDTTLFNQSVLERTTVFSGVKDGALYTFVPLETHVASISTDGVAVFEDVDLVQGQWNGQSYDVAGSGIQTLIIEDSGIDISTLEVKHVPTEASSESAYYQRYASPFDLGTDAEVFFLSLNRDEQYEIEFGDGVVSKHPEDGVVIAQFVSTSGLSGNGISVISGGTLISGSSNVEVVTTSASYGGADEETKESIRALAPVAFGARGVAVTANQYIPIVRELFPNANVKTWGGEDNVPIKQGYTMICVKPSTADALNAAEKAALIKYLEARNVGSITPELVDPTYTNIVVSTLVKWDTRETDSNAATLRADVASGVADWSANHLEVFGADFDLLELSTYIRDDIDDSIVSNVTSVSYNKTVSDVANGVYSVLFSHAVKQDTVQVSGLYGPSGAELALRDSNGLLYLYSNNELDTSSSFGSVNYSTGAIELTFPVGYYSDVLTVAVSPNELDANIDSVRNDILRITDVVVETEVREDD